MKATILLNYGNNTKAVEDEEKNRFLHDILEQMGVPLDFWISADSLSVEQKIKLRSILVNYNIQVLDDLDGNMQIYVEGELVGEWRKCTYKLKRDLRELDPRKQLYLEMLVDCWTVFEEEQEL